MFTLKEIVRLAVQVEQNGEKIYREAQKEASNPAVGSLLGWLADDEARHARWFEQLEARMGEGHADPKLGIMAETILSDILGDQSFSLKGVDFSDMRGATDLLKVAIEFEQDTVIFYQMLGSFVEDPETHRHLEAIIAEENEHIRTLQNWAQNQRHPLPAPRQKS